MKQLITHSRQACFKECRRKHFFAYELMLRRIEDAKALRIGSAVHGGLERLPDLEAACNSVRAAYATCPENFDAYWWAIEQETVLRLICGYQWRWGEAKLEMLAPEKAFRLPLVNPRTGRESFLFDLAGKIDGVVRLEDGRLAVKETKTASDDLLDDSDLWRWLRIDQQISLYISAARRLGFQVDTVLYDVIRKPTIQPTPVPLTDEAGVKIVLDAQGQRVRTKDGKKWRETGDTAAGYVLQTRPMTVEEWGDKLSADIAERPDFYFQRKEIPRLDGDVDECVTELWEIQQTLREAQRSGKWFRTVTKNCAFCPYFEPCTTGFDPESGEVPPGFEYVTDPHPELNGECNVINDPRSPSSSGAGESAAAPGLENAAAASAEGTAP